MAGGKRQTKMSFSVTPKPNTPTPPISKLLSQYELLGSLCQHLSSADIIHLGATSKEHWASVASSPAILNGLISHSSCDGRGIAAQARVYGYWGGDATQATRTCRGKNAKTCVDCGAMVCNTCRFHIRYPDNIPLFKDEDALNGWDRAVDDGHEYWNSDWDEEEMQLGLDFNDCVVLKEDVTHEVELTRAIWMYKNKILRHCEDCEPLFAHINFSKMACNCTLYCRFAQPWRCIPCVMSEETNSVVSQQKYRLAFRSGERRPWSYEKILFCACGKQVVEKATDFCGWCNRISGYYCSRDPSRLARIHVQLGTCLDDRSNDPILSQLG